MVSLVNHVRKQVAPRDYYSDVFPDIRWPTAAGEPRVHCCFHDERTPSLHVNPDSGAWYCHGCEAAGKSIVSFRSRLEDCTTTEAAHKLFHEYLHPTIDDRTVRKWVRQLANTPSALKHIRKARLISSAVIKRYKLGWDGNRIVLPISNEFGIWVNAKLYDPLGGKRGLPKMINYSSTKDNRQYGTPAQLFPLGAMDLAREQGYVIVCEGEWDALALLSLGIPAITSSAGCKSWPEHQNELFRGLEVIIAYDNDKDGQKYDKIPLRQLVNVAQVIKRLRVPRKVGKDVTDWLIERPLMRNAEAWRAKVRNAKLLIDNPSSLIANAKEVVEVPLAEATKAELFGRRIEVDALVTGKDTAPYALPRKFRVSCAQDCDLCPLLESQNEYKECEVDPTSPKVLGMIDASESQIKKALSNIAGFGMAKPGCMVKVEVTQMFNVEQALLIPTLDTSNGQYVMRSSYFVGHGLNTNRSYKFLGCTLPHPKDQHATHLFDVAHPVQDDIETFELSEELKRGLRKFQPKRLTLMGHLMAIAEWQSQTITKIHERPDLHIAVDLVFHSVPAFNFNGEEVRRGMLDVLILGDTRCGKGYVTEGLSKYYGLGEVASGENCTFAGLVGGLQQSANRWFVTWGKIPLNHGRLVVIDEASALSESDIGHMSRVRSEGVAEISKIVSESTRANARLLWLSNPRSGRPILSYNAGVQAIKELVGANEDISRFDFAITVATSEVPSEIINALDHTTENRNRYSREICRALILWAWSRRSDQITFTRGATATIIKSAIEFGRVYSPTIPLVQAENIRIKLAKVAAAVAARVFSTDASCEKVVIKTQHVKVAIEFLKQIYAKPSMGYEQYSRSSAASAALGNEEAIADKMAIMGSDLPMVIDGLLEIHRITPTNLADYVGDPQTSKVLIGELVKLRCLTMIEGANWYLKNPAFTQWLRKQKQSNDRTNSRLRRRKNRT